MARTSFDKGILCTNLEQYFKTIFQLWPALIMMQNILGSPAIFWNLELGLLKDDSRSYIPHFFSSHIRGFFVFSSSLTSKLLFKINIIIFLVLSDWWNFVPAHRRIGGVIHYFVFFFVFGIRSLFTFSMLLFTSHHINGGRETVCLAHRGIGGPGRGGLENLTATRATPAR